MKVLFRAKTLNQNFKEEKEGLKKIGNTWYAIGKEQPCDHDRFENIKLCAIITENNEPYLCDYDTRSINFEDMIESEGSKIFASLSEDGRGGDIVECSNRKIKRGTRAVCKYQGFGKFLAMRVGNYAENWSLCWVKRNTSIVGVQ